MSVQDAHVCAGGGRVFEPLGDGGLLLEPLGGGLLQIHQFAFAQCASDREKEGMDKLCSSLDVVTANLFPSLNLKIHRD